MTERLRRIVWRVGFFEGWLHDGLCEVTLFNGTHWRPFVWRFFIEVKDA